MLFERLHTPVSWRQYLQPDNFLLKPALPFIVAQALMAAACSRAFESSPLGMAWTPPSGVRLVSQDSGPPARAVFEGGITWYRIDGAAVSMGERGLPAMLESIAAAGHVALNGTVTSARTGTLPVGAVARYELRAAATRTLAYVIPRSGGAMLLLATASEAQYGRTSASVELSLSTVRWR
jgi:hypothetical protein